MSVTPRFLFPALLAAGLVGGFSAGLAGAADAPAAAGPSAASIKELMTLTESRKLIDGLPGQVEAAMQKGLQQALGGQELTPAQQKVLTELGTKTTALFSSEMGWGTLEPMFTAIYSKTFTQSEIDGMIAFYKTPAGQAVIAKMPLVMQSTMDLVQERMQALQPKLVKYQQEAVEQLRADEKKEAPAKQDAPAK